MNNFLNATITIAYRDFTKYIKDRTRLLFSLVFPLVFLGILGSQNQSAFGSSFGENLLLFTFIGTITNTMFQSTAQGIVSLLEDRDNDFAQEIFISPIPRSAIALGKILGETLVSVGGVITQLILIPFLGIPVDFVKLLSLFPFLLLVSFLGGGFGLTIISFLKTQKASNQVFPLLMFPQFFLAGIFTPLVNQSPVLYVLSRLSPLTYAVDLIRNVYYNGQNKILVFNFWFDLFIVLLLVLVFTSYGMYMFIRNEKNK